jgi:hypothetical protein
LEHHHLQSQQDCSSHARHRLACRQPLADQPCRHAGSSAKRHLVPCRRLCRCPQSTVDRPSFRGLAIRTPSVPYAVMQAPDRALDAQMHERSRDPMYRGANTQPLPLPCQRRRLPVASMHDITPVTSLCRRPCLSTKALPGLRLCSGCDATQRRVQKLSTSSRMSTPWGAYTRLLVIMTQGVQSPRAVCPKIAPML